MGGNREYKSDVFSMLMENPEHALSVYNALNGSNYNDSSLITMLKLENGIQLSIRNDASFLIDHYLNLYEHQSSPNPNMPLRFLIYVTELFQSIIRNAKNGDLFSSTLMKVPTPRFIVFYNGMEKRKEAENLKLSDAFEHPMEVPELELICKVYNINPGHNEELLEKCSVLDEYTAFVERVRFYKTQYPLDEALDLAIENCIAEHILEEFLSEHRGEVKRVMTLDYTFERRLQLAREEKEQLEEEIEQLEGRNEQLEGRNEQLGVEKELLAKENRDLSAKVGVLQSEMEQLKKLLTEHGIA